MVTVQVEILIHTLTIHMLYAYYTPEWWTKKEKLSIQGLIQKNGQMLSHLIRWAKHLPYHDGPWKMHSLLHHPYQNVIFNDDVWNAQALEILMVWYNTYACEVPNH